MFKLDKMDKFIILFAMLVSAEILLTLVFNSTNQLDNILTVSLVFFMTEVFILSSPNK